MSAMHCTVMAIIGMSAVRLSICHRASLVSKWCRDHKGFTVQ